MRLVCPCLHMGACIHAWLRLIRAEMAFKKQTKEEATNNYLLVDGEIRANV